MMEPVGVKYEPGKGLQMAHRFMSCGIVRANKVARRTMQPDEWEALLRLPAE